MAGLPRAGLHDEGVHALGEQRERSVGVSLPSFGVSAPVSTVFEADLCVRARMCRTQTALDRAWSEGFGIKVCIQDRGWRMSTFFVLEQLEIVRT